MIDLNCDVGEGLNNEHLLMPFITSCSIACGGHAGNKETMTKVVALAAKHNVKIGAHPSYPDIENFGRKSMLISKKKLSETLLRQIAALENIVFNFRLQLSHIKPHGALYNDIAKNETIATNFLDVIENYKTKCKLFVPYGSVIATEADRRNFDIVYEAFVDRNYNDDLSLVSRNKNNAIIKDIKKIITQITQIKNEGKVTTITGKIVPLEASTFCVHSDTKNAVEIVKKLCEQFN